MVFGAVKTVLDALGNVHRRGILHLNINMDGIFVDLYGRGWILNLDTGERYMLDKFISVPPLSIPEDGIEMYLKKGAKGPWTDIYALCADLPFKGKNGGNVLRIFTGRFTDEGR